jgi:hypothetical protein
VVSPRMISFSSGRAFGFSDWGRTCVVGGQKGG